MFGSFIGNVAGISYFLAFQILGILLALYLFQKEKTGTTLLFGSVFGSFALHWLPTIYAFFFQFSVKAHLFAFITFVAIVWAVLAFGKEHTLFKGRFKKPDIVALFRENPALFLLLPLFIYTCYVLLHATIPYINGSLHSGQSTYGDMNMHLGFITSIAKQKLSRRNTPFCRAQNSPTHFYPTVFPQVFTSGELLCGQPIFCRCFLP